MSAHFLWSMNDLVRLSEHPHPEVRRWACMTMRSLYREQGVSILDRLLRDPDSDVLSEALSYLEAYPHPSYKGDLLKLYTTRNDPVVGRCASLLGRMKEDGWVKVFLKRVRSGKAKSAEIMNAIEGLAELGTGETRSILREVLTQAIRLEEPFVVEEVVEGLLRAGEDPSFLLGFCRKKHESLAMTILSGFTQACGAEHLSEEMEGGQAKSFLKKKLPPVVAESLTHLEKRGLASVAKGLRKAFSKENYREVMERAWAEMKEWKADVEGRGGAVSWSSPLTFSYRIMEAFCGNAEDGPPESLRPMAVAALVILSQWVDRRCFVPPFHAEEKDLFKTLFEDRMTVETDDRLIERALETFSSETVFERSLAQLRHHPDSLGTLRALRVLGKLKDPSSIPHLVGFFKEKATKEALKECGESLKGMGPFLISYLEANGNKLTAQEWKNVLFVLADLPYAGADDLLIRHWDRLWIEAKKPFLVALEGIASRKFIDPLRKEWREGEVADGKTLLVLCLLYGVKDPILPQIEREVEEDRKKRERRIQLFEEEGDLSQERSLPVELRCRLCKRSYHYELRDVYILPTRKEAFRIMDKIVCKNCKAVNQYEVPTEAMMAITAFAVITVQMVEEGKWDPVLSPVKFAESGLTDGRRMSFEEALKQYEKDVAKAPQDPALRVGYGNILAKMGRWEEAVAHFEEALRLDPLAVEAYYSLGEYEADQNHLSKAYEYFRKAADRMGQGHYYRTKDEDQLKEAIVTGLEKMRSALGIEETPPQPLVILPPSSGEKTLHGPPSEPKVSRNAPCPCGSGKKYKKCCMLKNEPEEAPETSTTPEEQILRSRLASFSMKSKYRGDLEKAYRLFFRKRFRPPHEMEEEERIRFHLFLDWFIYDYPLRSGLTMVEEFSRQKEDRISDKDRFLLQWGKESCLSLYEVRSVTPNRGMTLRDLFTEEEIDVFEVSGTREIVKWDILFTRLIRMGSVNKLSGIATTLPREVKDEVISSIQDLWAKAKQEEGLATWPAFMKAYGHRVYHLTVDRKKPEPTFVTEEHHPILASQAIYDVLQFDPIRERLLREFDFLLVEESEQSLSFDWLKRGPSKGWETLPLTEKAVVLMSQMLRGHGELKWSSLGKVELTRQRLVLSCLSKERLERGKVRLQETIGRYIKHRVDKYEDILEKERAATEKRPSERPSPKGPEDYSVQAQFLEDWARSLLDEKIPALGGMTPREAVKTPEGRDRVKELLRLWENVEEHKRRIGEPSLDVNALRKMLGLEAE